MKHFPFAACRTLSTSRNRAASRTRARSYARSYARSRRRGIAVVYVGLFLTVFMSVAALSIDLSRLYVARSQAQKAADAAALAGAYQYASVTGGEADRQARFYAGKPENGAYVDGVRNTTVTPVYQPKDELGVQQMRWYRVTVNRLEPTFFAGIFGKQFRQVAVGAQATARFDNAVELSISGTGTYGVSPGPANLSLFGPAAWYNNGDRYSAQYINNDTTKPNPDYFGPGSLVPTAKQGYSFSINLDDFRGKSGNGTAYLQLFDPDCYNANNAVDASTGVAIDEMRKPDGSGGTSTNATTTKYKLWVDLDGEGPLPETAVSSSGSYSGEASYGDTASTDMLWTDFYAINVSSIPVAAKARLQVVSTAGSSENGFNLRIDNKPAASAAIQKADRDKLALSTNKNKTVMEQEALKDASNRFDPNNGSIITAQGHLPINFNQDGQVTMALGNIPASAGGGNMTITNFDTDVTASSGRPNTVYYKCDPPAPNQPAQGFLGVMSGNGESKSFDIALPVGYQGGKWSATYAAGIQDTSVWDMSYEKGPGTPGGNVSLIR